MRTREIIDENFKGLSQFIKDKDILEWYKCLIATCMSEYAREAYQIDLPSDEEIDKMAHNYADVLQFTAGAVWMRRTIKERRMRTKEEILDNAKECHSNEYQGGMTTSMRHICFEAMTEYAREACEEQRRICAETVKKYYLKASDVSAVKPNDMIKCKPPEGL